MVHYTRAPKDKRGSMEYTQLNLEDVTARKRRYCQWCDTIIKIGEVYTRHTYIYDGFTTEAFHAVCYEALYHSNFKPGDEVCMNKHKKGCPCDCE